MKTALGSLATALLLVVTACGGQTDDPPDTGTHAATTPTPSSGDSPTPAAGQPRMVATWSEAEARDLAGWLQAHVEPRLLRGEQIGAFVADLPAALDAQELRDVDPSTTAVLVAGYSECGNAGRAVVDEGVVSYVVRRTADHECVWAPVRVQAFAVPADVTLA